MGDDNSVKITISGKLNYEDEINLSQAAQIIAFIDSTSGTIVSPPAGTMRLAPAAAPQVIGSSATTPREALEKTSAKTNPEKIVTFAGMIHDEGKDTFTIEDIKPLFRRAREATPKNISRDLDGAIRSGWVTDADEKGEYYLTSKGLQAIEAGFVSSRSTRTTNGSTTRVKNGSARKARRSPMEVPEVFKAIDPISGDLEGLPSYSSLKSDQDRFLWSVAFAKAHGIDGLENKEIAWLTDRLGAGVLTNLVASKFASALKQGHVNRSTSTNKIRITPKGEERLRSLSEA